jgi:hypothetical protein
LTGPAPASGPLARRLFVVQRCLVLVEPGIGDGRQERLGVRLLKSVGPHFTLGMKPDQPLASRHSIIVALSPSSGQAHIQRLVGARGWPGRGRWHLPRRQEGGLAAVVDELAAGDERRIVAGHEADQVSQLAGLARAVQRDDVICYADSLVRPRMAHVEATYRGTPGAALMPGPAKFGSCRRAGMPRECGRVPPALTQ